MHQKVREAVEKNGLAKHIKDVLIAVYDEIIARRIVSVSDLLDYLDGLDWDDRLELVVRRSFKLIRELHWGIFRELDPEHHPDLWRALTVSSRRMPAISDLKRNVMVPEVYCALLDIHAYTAFCQKNRHNVSMLRTLDDMIQRHIREIAHRQGCLSIRSAGDNIVVIGPSPSQIIHTCLGIIDAFSRKRVLEAARLAESRQGNSVVMQDMEISGGIAGGLRYHSLIVTQDGDISGSIVNTAARLQAFANTVSPSRSKVMVTSHVYTGYRRQRQRNPEKVEKLAFFNRGKVRFKGTAVVVHELLYSKEEMRKAAYQSEYSELVAMTRQGRWSERLVPLGLGLVIRVLETEPVPTVELEGDGGSRRFSSEAIAALCRDTSALYEKDRDHRRVSGRLKLIATVLERCDRFDAMVLTQFLQITELYGRMTRQYEALQYEKILENQTGLFSIKERSLLSHATKLEEVRKGLIERGMKDNNIYSSTVLWNRIVSEFDGTWEVDVYSGKR